MHSSARLGAPQLAAALLALAMSPACSTAPAAPPDVAAADVAAADVAPLDATPSPDAEAPPDASPDAVEAARVDGTYRVGVRPDRPYACPATGPIEDTFDWAPPRAVPNACSEDDLDAIERALSNSALTPEGLALEVSAGCFACAYSPPDDVTWGPLFFSHEGLTTWMANTPGCLQTVGVTERCAIAYNDLVRCATAACDGCALPRYSTCFSSAAVYADDGPCASRRRPYDVACAFMDRRFGACASPEDATFVAQAMRAVRTMCGPR
ncbi:MAG: hypothetical protein U0324_27720 [Polyangiales bacterium]